MQEEKLVNMSWVSNTKPEKNYKSEYKESRGRELKTAVQRKDEAVMADKTFDHILKETRDHIWHGGPK